VALRLVRVVLWGLSDVASQRRIPTASPEREGDEGESTAPSHVAAGRVDEAAVGRRLTEASIVREMSDARTTADAIVREVQGARVRLNAAIEASRRLRSSLEARPVRSGVYPSTSAEKGWVLLVTGRAEHSRRLFLQLLGGGFHVDVAGHAEEVASLAPLRRWAALVLDGVVGDARMRAAIRVARSLPSLAMLPIIVAHEGVVPADVRSSSAAVVREWAGEDLADVVSSVLRSNGSR
jgi:hypothetical protein